MAFPYFMNPKNKAMKTQYYPLLFLMLALPFGALGQPIDQALLDRVKMELTQAQLSAYSAAEQQARQGQTWEAEADNMYQDLNKVRFQARAAQSRGERRRLEKQAQRLNDVANDRLMMAGGEYEQAHEAMFAILLQKTAEIRPDRQTDQYAAGMPLEEQALDKFEQARAGRRMLLRNPHAQTVDGQLKQMAANERDGLNLQIQAIAIYFGWKAIPKQPDSEPEAAEPEANPNAVAIDPGIRFKVQIIALSEPASAGVLSELYSGELPIEERFDARAGTYHYMVGEFQRYEQARDFQQRLRVEDGFVVAMKNGLRVDLRQAIEATGGNLE